MRRVKVLSPETLRRKLAALRREGKRTVFTNGVFDLIHPGHVRYLRTARGLGDVLVVGINTDASARRLGKGPGRPIVTERDRAEVLAALEMVDFVTFFDEDTPVRLIRLLAPDVLVKGGDWSPDRIAGADFVRSRGGVVQSIPYVEGYATTGIVRRMRKLAGKGDPEPERSGDGREET